MQVLVINLAEGFGRAIRATVESNVFVVGIARSLEAIDRAVDLAFHLGRSGRRTDVPDLQLLRGTRQLELVHLIINSGLGVTESHLVARHLQAAPNIDEDIIHIAFRCRAGTKGIVFQRDAHRLASRLHADPTTHFVGIGVLGGAGRGSNGIGGFLHVVDPNLKRSGLEISSCQSRLDPARPCRNHIGKTEIKVLGRVEVHAVAKVGAARAVQVVIILFVHLIIKELVDNDFCRYRRCRSLTDALAIAQTRDHKSICVVVVRILLVRISRLQGIALPAYWTTTIEEDIVVVVKLAIRLARDKDGNLHQVVRTRHCIQLRQHAAAVVIDADLARVNRADIDTQLSEVGSRQLVDARLGKANFVPVATCHDRTCCTGRTAFLRFKIGCQSHRERGRQQFLDVVTHLAERHYLHHKERFITSA